MKKHLKSARWLTLLAAAVLAFGGGRSRCPSGPTPFMYNASMTRGSTFPVSPRRSAPVPAQTPGGSPEAV